MNSKKVIPAKGQTWVSGSSGEEVLIKGFNASGNLVISGFSLAIPVIEFVEMFTFKPANDLEWLAVNYTKWELTGTYGYIKRDSTAGVCVHRPSGVCADSRTRKQWQDKRDELFGITEELEVKMNNNVKIYPVNAGFVKADFERMAKKIGAALVESGVKMNIDDIAKEDGVVLKPVYTQAMSDAGELLPIGSECEAMEHGNKWHFIEVFAHHKNTAHFYMPNLDDYGHSEGVNGNFRPLDTRTDKQRLLDDLQNDIKNLKETVLNGGSEAEYLLRKYNITRKDAS